MVWDDRLLTQAEAYQIAACASIAWHHEGSGRLVLRHTSCEQSCGVWTSGQPTELDDITAAIIRHMVTVHDLPMNRPARERLQRERDDSGSGTQWYGAEAGSAAAAARPYRAGPGGAGAAPAAPGDDADGTDTRA
jgi:hypothetical protein